MFTVMFDLLSKSLYLIIYIGFKEGNVLFNDTQHISSERSPGQDFL